MLKYHSSKYPNSYYVFTTIDGINMPRFAPICHFRYIFNNFHGKSKLRKLRQNTANRGILGRRNNMISIFFVCYGSTAGSRELAALVGQNGANCGNRGDRVLRLRKLKTESVEVLTVNGRKEI